MFCGLARRTISGHPRNISSQIREAKPPWFRRMVISWLRVRGPGLTNGALSSQRRTHRQGVTLSPRHTLTRKFHTLPLSCPRSVCVVIIYTRRKYLPAPKRPRRIPLLKWSQDHRRRQTANDQVLVRDILVQFLHHIQPPQLIALSRMRSPLAIGRKWSSIRGVVSEAAISILAPPKRSALVMALIPGCVSFLLALCLVICKLLVVLPEGRAFSRSAFAFHALEPRVDYRRSSIAYTVLGVIRIVRAAEAAQNSPAYKKYGKPAPEATNDALDDVAILFLAYHGGGERTFAVTVW